VVSVAPGAIFDLNSYNETIGGLGGNGNVTLGNGTLTVGATGASGSFGGILSGQRRDGQDCAGIQTISATNTYLGATTVAAGTLAIANVATLGTGPVVMAGGTLQLTATRDTVNGILSNGFVLSSNSIVQNTASATAGTRNLPFGGSVIATNGTLTLQSITSGNFTNVMNLRFHGSITNFHPAIVFDIRIAASAVE